MGVILEFLLWILLEGFGIRALQKENDSVKKMLKLGSFIFGGATFVVLYFMLSGVAG